MRKLKLDVEALQVESFEALPPRIRRGTVAAHDLVNDPFYPEVGWESGGGGGGGGYTEGTCIGPTFCCPPTWNNCPVIDINTASRVISAIVKPCGCTA